MMNDALQSLRAVRSLGERFAYEWREDFGNWFPQLCLRKLEM